MKILIIDDDELIRMTCRNILKKEGYTVVEAIDGNSGVRLFKSEKPDVVVTDMLMPDKEGLETISDILEIDPKAKIVAVSGGGSTQNMVFLKVAQQLGAGRVLKKPFKPSELIATIKILIKE